MNTSKGSPTVALLPEGVEVPPGIHGLAAFRAWAHSDQFPRSGRIDWISGRIEVDMSPEDLNTHASPKTTIAAALTDVVHRPGKGMVFIDRTRISSPSADLSAEPDVVVVLLETLKSGRARLVPKAMGAPGRFVEIEGAVDLVVECVSDSSVEKDTKRLREVYHRAGVPEYWTVDVRAESIELSILLHEPSGYAPAPADSDGFFRSPLLGERVRLARDKEAEGLVFFRLDRRP